MKIIIPDALLSIGILLFLTAFGLLALGESLCKSSKKWIRSLGNVLVNIIIVLAVIGVFLTAISAIGDFVIVR